MQRPGILHCDEYCWVRDQINSEDTLGGAVCQTLSLEGCQGEAKPLFIEIPAGLFFCLIHSFCEPQAKHSHIFLKREQKRGEGLFTAVEERIIGPPGRHEFRI